VISTTGGYDWAFIIAGVLLVIGATSILTLARRPLGDADVVSAAPQRVVTSA
jgi:hypothetical protein